MARSHNNSNELSDRNGKIYKERQEGALVADISNRYNLSIPRVHRIIMQEDNKHLRKEVDRLKKLASGNNE